MAQLNEGARLCGRYTLIRRLGRGGMAEVWLAEDAPGGGRVALKCLLPEFAARPEMLRLFEQECRRVARLEHPHIVRVRAFHGDASPPCFSMDAIDGPDLRVARGRPAAELAALLAPVADALCKAHGLGLVHRDLKPSNVLLDAAGRAWLTDFGIAAALEAAPETATGELRAAGGGSAEFASPEQRAGLPPAVSDDAWGFGRLIQALLAPAERLGPLGQLASRLTAAAPAARPADFGAIRDQLRSMAGETLAVRRPAGLQPPGTMANRPAARAGGGGARWAWGGLAGLLAVLAAVVFLLPEWVAERRAAAPPEARRQPAEPPARETAADEIRRLVEARRAADAVRERLDAVLAGLEARAVERWAGAEFATLQAGVAAGAEAHERRDYGRAAEAWEQALAGAQALEARRPGIVAQALADGARAIEAGQSRAATEAFGMAVAADPGNPAAVRGLERAAGLDAELAARAAAEARLQAETLRRAAAIRRLEAEA
ncbi:MAG: protein kinase domain-containing protein, partial [Gammaproteobacteria bacterium]